jgi:hypothetical protein
MNFIPNVLSDMNTIQPIVWKNSSIEEKKQRLGLAKLTIPASPTAMEEESSCSTPRRISFTQLDQIESMGLPPALENTNKTRTKTVRFAPQLSTATDSKILWNGVLTEEHCQELWYQKSELAAIKHAAKVTIANRAKVQGDPNASSEEQDDLIGLERFSKQRAVWKKSAIRCIMMAQRQINSLYGIHNISKEDYIQRISMRCTDWARDAAEKQGFHDYCAVHDPLAALFSDSEAGESEKENEQNYNELIFGDATVDNITNKRKVGVACDADIERETVDFGRKRHRASPPLVL